MNKLIKWYFGLNIYNKLLPFLLVYILVSLLFPQGDSFGDEGRYLMFAHNIINGFYSPAYPDFNLWNGPGYPLFIAPLLSLKIPLAGLRIANALLLYFSLIISFKTFSFFSTPKKALVFTILLGLYLPILEYVRTIVTETLTWFLISSIVYLFLKNFINKALSWKLILLCAFAIAYLAMTKIIFGYVIILMLFVSVVFCIFPRFRTSAKRAALIYLISFIFCLPWLFYTFSLTNKPLYWGNSGSMSLYTMSTPYDGETGDWYDEITLLKNPNHAAFMDSVLKLSPLERDEAFKTAAVNNIKSHPKKYLTNIVSNIGRLFFFPSVYTPNSIASYIPFLFNIFIVVFIVLSSGISLFQYKNIPHAVIFLFLFFLIYSFGSIFLSAYRRMFYVSIPFWGFFIFYIFNNFISIDFKSKADNTI